MVWKILKQSEVIYIESVALSKYLAMLLGGVNKFIRGFTLGDVEFKAFGPDYEFAGNWQSLLLGSTSFRKSPFKCGES